MTTWRDKARLVLVHRENETDSRHNEDFPPVMDLADALDENARFAQRKVRLYKWSGLFALLAIPLLSTIVSILVADGGQKFRLDPLVLPVLSAALTLVTLLNSIMKPGERFQAACRVCMRVRAIGNRLLESLATADRVDDKTLVAIVNKHRRRLLPLQEELIQLFLPTNAASDRADVSKPEIKVEPQALRHA
jgi:hypothetical protein